MEITKIEVKNYRLLKNFSIDLKDELSLVIGKNNTGKTSLLSIMDKFLNSATSDVFSFDDFNLDFSEDLKKWIESESKNYKEDGIRLKIFIDYNEEDNLTNISKLMMDLNPKNNKILLLFEYILTADKCKKLKNDFFEFKNKQKKQKDLFFFLKNNHHRYFKLFKKTIDLKDENNFTDLGKKNISLKNVINYKVIKANRDVSNKDSDKSLSSLSSNIYERMKSTETHQYLIDKLTNTLHDADDSLNENYKNIFTSVIEKVEKFGGIHPKDTDISITSTLQQKDILKSNTTVLYKHGEHKLPESYNGLGYMNLINIIFEIEIKINEFNRKIDDNPADINLLFIEEPEAHTHPQMQYIFIKNIKNLLKNRIDDEKKLQSIISTHSSHIVSESDFNDIKYLKIEKNSVVSKNLSELENQYSDNTDDSKNEIEKRNFRFLKRYLTLNKAELFFADKAIFIEGDTERILLPAIMKKIDQEKNDQEEDTIPLLSQNISIVETGAYSHIFEKFIDFIGIKSLIITDIDSANIETEKCKVVDGAITTNASLKFFYNQEGNLNEFKDKDIIEMILKKDPQTKQWVKDKNGSLLCVYQREEKNSDNQEYHARSFEDSFIHLNCKFITSNLCNFKSLKNIKDFKDNSKDSYDLANHCIKSKPTFAIDILLNSETKEDGITKKDFSNWDTPDYIVQGLSWLKKD